MKNVVYKNIKGTGASEVAIKFDCSKTYPCEGILMHDVNLEREGAGTAIASCNNVKLAELGVVSPKCPWWTKKNLEQGKQKFPRASSMFCD